MNVCISARILIQKPSLFVIIVLLSMMLTAECCAAPTLTIPTTTNVGANMATLVLQSSGTGTGYFTLLVGSNASCGTGTQVQAGQTSTGAIAPYHGSLPLTANTAASYTVRNLTQSSAYTVCFTADSPTGANLNATPVSANITTATTTAIFNPAWGIVGSAGFSGTKALYTSLAFAPDGTPYVAYQDTFYNGKATTRKFSGGAWNVVWTGGFTAGQADYTSLAFSPDGIPYVAYKDSSVSGKASVMKCYGAWSVVGSAGSANYYAQFTSLAFAPDGTPFVAFTDGTSGKAMVMKYSAGSWSIVGNSGFSASGVYYTSLAFSPDGTPYVAYMDYGYSSKATVMKYSGGVWSVVGSVGFSSGLANYISLAIAPDGTPYVAYGDGSNSFKATVMKYSAGAWNVVGDAGFSAGNTGYTSLAIAPDGTPYVAYQDVVNSDKATVMKFSGGAWNAVGNVGFTSQAAAFTSLAFSPDGTPYVAYQDGGSKATVMKLINNLPPIISGTPAVTATIGTPYSFTPTASYASSFSISGTIPPGLSFSTTTGALSGTPTTSGTYSNIVITATNSAGSASLPAFSITVSPPSYNLSIATQGTGSDCVTLSTGGGCVSSFGGSFTSGTVVTITPTPSTGSVFSSWSGCDSVSGNQCTVTMTAAKSVTATFALVPTLITLTTTNLGANMATVVMQSSGTGTGYFTLLAGTNANCGTGAQVKAGQTDTGSAAPRFGSLSFTANTASSYTVYNLTQSSAYTVCLTADSSTGSSITPTPVSVNLTTAAPTTYTSPAWSVVGSAGFSADWATYTSLAFAPDGTPYVAYEDYGNNDKATVMKYSAGVWSVVGSAGFSAGSVWYTSLAFAPDGTPYVAYSDGSNSWKATVMKYSAGAWSVVGSVGFSAGSVRYPSLAFAPDGTPYVAYEDYGNNDNATVMKYSAGVWSVVGSAGFSDGGADYTSLAFAPDGTPYVAYYDYGNNGKATVKKFSDGTWSVVGSAGFSVSGADYISLAFAPDGTPYVAYADRVNSGKLIAMKYSGGAWSMVGSAGFSAGGADYISLAFAPDGTPYVAYSDIINGNTYKASVMKYSGGAWSVVGSDGVSAGRADYTSLAFAPDGTPYVAYLDGGSGYKATVMKLVNLPIISGSPATTAIVGTSYSFTPTASYVDSFSVTGTIPPGLSLSTSTGVLSGIPITAGTYSNIVITATNSFGSTSLPTFSLTVSPSSYDLSVATQGTGSGCVTLSTSGGCVGSVGGSFAIGTVVTITPTPSSDSAFSSWSGCDSLSGNQCIVTMTAAKSVTATFTDITPPDTTITSSPAISTTSTNFSFGFTATEAGSTFECKLGTGAWGPCTSPYNNSIVYAVCTTCRTDTSMSFSVQAKDPAGNVDPTPASYSWVITHPLANPFDNVIDGGVVQLKAINLTGDLIFTRPITFTIKGGYDPGYSIKDGQTNIHGAVTISDGTVIFENVSIM